MSTVCGEIYQEMKVSPKIQKVESRKKKKKEKNYMVCCLWGKIVKTGLS